jgi:anthraniloyl-CoA monooxygenase
MDVSTGQTVVDSRPVYGRMFQTPFAEQIRNEARMATMCVGNITTPDQVNSILAAGRADLVALGRPHLVDPYFTLHAAAQYGVATTAVPRQYESGQAQALRTQAQAQVELTELRLKAKPKQHAVLTARAAE